MKCDTSTKPSLKGYSIKAYFKLITFSTFGILAFFISFPLPGYQVSVFGWQFGAVSGNSTMLVTHITSFIRAALWDGSFKAMPAIIWLFGIYCLIDLFLIRFDNFWCASIVTFVFSIFKILGFVLLTITAVSYYFGVYPAVFSWFFTGMESIGGANVSFFILDRILVPICIILPVTAVLLPLLADYGLVDFIGVVSRRFMRPILRLPGRAAVITVSALLANFSVGHIAANDQYKSGRMSARESIIIATCLSTVSMGFMLVLAHNTNLMHIWNAYLWSTFLIVIVVTLVGVRIYPLNKLPDTFYEGVVPVPEKEYNKHIVRYAIKEALDTATAADKYRKRAAYIMKESAVILGACVVGPTIFATAGLMLYSFTPIFTWIGYIFWPFVRIAIPASEAVTASSGAALGFLENMMPSLLVASGEWSMRTRYMLAVVPVTAVVFLASFVPCIMATSLPVKFGHLVIIWLERVVLSIIFAALISLILFPT